ncbi:hypothetical protein O9X98_06945 [Agrobacterium salinitolerans]|nr:hypothetical protein [Agrobacterium salinitolerans]
MSEKPNDIILENAVTLANTAVATADGRLLVVHHATNRTFENFETSADMGFHFGAWAQAVKRRANMISRGEGNEGDDWSVVSCALAIRNPLVIADDPGFWGLAWVTATLASYLDEGDKNAIRTLATELHDTTRAAAGPTDDRRIADQWFRVLKGALKRAGHDGIIYRNIFEASGRAIEWSWVAFDDSQIVRLPDMAEVGTIEANFPVGKPPKLRGAGPMRHHQARGTGLFVRETDAVAFREVVLEWAENAGVAWKEDYPLDYEPSFGECRPSYDLQAKIGGDAGVFIRVSSKRGEVTFQPYSQSERAEALMARYRSDASEAFFLHGTDRMGGDESVTWRPAEPLHAFADRLAAVYADLEAEYVPERAIETGISRSARTDQRMP